MAGKDRGLVGQSCQRLQAVVHLLGIRAREVGSSATVEKQCVPGNEATTREETLASRSVTRGVNERDVDFTHGQRVTGRMGDEVRHVDFCRSNHPRNLSFVHVNRHVVLFKEMCDAVYAVTHH